MSDLLKRVLLKLLTWINETTVSYPKIRSVLIKLAIFMGVPRILQRMRQQVAEPSENNAMEMFAGKKRMLIQIKPSVRRCLKQIEHAKQNGLP